MVRRLLGAAVLMSVLGLAVAPALAYCHPPSAPQFQTFGGTPQPPQTPYCVDTFTNTHTCDRFQIDNYNRQVERYNEALDRYYRDVESYAQAVDRYYDEAVRYVDCLLNAPG